MYTLNKIKPRIQTFKHLLLSTINSFIEHRASSKAAALAFYALFSITPVMVIAIAIASYFYGADAAKGQIISHIQVFVGQTMAQSIQDILSSTHHQSNGILATIVATIVFFFAATSALSELKESLDEIWKVDLAKQSAFKLFVKTQLLSIFMVILLSLLLLSSLLFNGGVTFLEKQILSKHLHIVPLLKFASSVLSYFFIVSLFVFIYKWLPSISVAWRDVCIGAMMTAILFSIGKYLIGVYLSKSIIASGFGAAGSVVVLLLWVYYSANIFFLGAIFTKEFSLNRLSTNHSHHLN